MEFPELSLAPTQFVVNKSSISSSPESDSNTSRKRKFFNDHSFKTDQAVHTSVDLQLKDPLPLDWEQCLDLEVNLSLSLSLSLLFLIILTKPLSDFSLVNVKMGSYSND